jgi:FSR family fosmidomycin resistance protein-like MFS transporter
MTAKETLDTVSASPQAVEPQSQRHDFMLKIVGGAAVAHLLNDLIQAMMVAIYPMLKGEFILSFAQIGMIGLVYQFTASLLQPWIGLYTDKHPKPHLLPAGMVVTLVGVALLATAQNYEMLLVAAAAVGVGSATFHPEASRLARMGSGGRFGTAQSTFQVGGNTGSAIGPLLAAAIIIPHGQAAVAWFALIAAPAVLVVWRLSQWSVTHGQMKLKSLAQNQAVGLPKGKALQAIVVVAVLMFAKFIYTASFTNYFTFYLIQKFGLTIQQSQLYLFAYLGAVALGTFAGGPVGDRIGRKAVIWLSFLGVAPFALALPYANLGWTVVLVVLIGLIMSSAFSALVVYAQEAAPGRVGMISGVMFGLMFGIGGIAAAGLGGLADSHGIEWVYKAASFLPLLGLATACLPSTKKGN